ncbi:hypothetical protein Pla163_19930 [Planctomycetes bacterium Pla163]|uniref:Uncharacterized protein n=1 Tax=Rohdeia mirabilis TaxID=2528008 RepID=A0A518D0A3_9BACT|nr:hypothetical protein Pla163_19930 [Planctomycetes bacterium Pla163]
MFTSLLLTFLACAHSFDTVAPAAAAVATSTANASFGPHQERAGQPRQQEPDPLAVERGEVALRDILVAAGSRPNLPGTWQEHLLWYDVAGVRYDALEVYRTRVMRPGERWRINHLEPRFLFANGAGRGYLLRELVTTSDVQGQYRPQFRREIGDGDVYWCEVDGVSLRENERAGLNASKVMLGEYFFGLMPHSLTLFSPQIWWLRNERLGERPHEVYRLVLPAPFEAEYGHASAEFDLYLDPRTKRISELRFPDPVAPNVTVIVRYSDWARVEASPEQLELWRTRLAETIGAQSDIIGEDGVEAFTALLDDPEGGLLPTGLVLPSRRSVLDDRGGHDREFLSADFHFEPLPTSALERPWQTGRVWTSPYRSDFFDPDPSGEGGPAGLDARPGGSASRGGNSGGGGRD